MYTYKDIKVIHLEITQRCQAACPMCDRNENGGKDNAHITNAELTLEDCQKIFKPEFIAQLTTMYMCGNLGDPIVAKDTLEVFKYFRKHNPNIWLNMNTNGGAKSPEWWQELALTMQGKGSVIFSVDGLEDTNHLYRQNVNWRIVEQSMRAFIGAGGRARWDFIVFDHNQHQVDQAREFANLLGFEKFIVKKTARFFSTAKNSGKEEHQSINRTGAHTILLKKPEQEYVNPALAAEQTLKDKYGSIKSYYDRCHISCKVSKEQNLFITAEGLVMPCCWTAGRMYKWWHTDYKKEQIWSIIDSAGGKMGISAKEHGLEHVINNTTLLQSIQDSWTKSSISEGKLEVCSNKCGSEFDPFGAQF